MQDVIIVDPNIKDPAQFHPDLVSKNIEKLNNQNRNANLNRYIVHLSHDNI